MYFANIEALKEQHTSGQFGSRDSFHYLLATFIAVCVVYSFVSFPPSDWLALSYVIDCVFTIAILIAGYVANGGSQGSQFADRFFSTGWVVGIRLLPFGIVLGVAAAFGDAGYYGDTTSHIGPYYIAATIVFQLMYLWRLAVNLKDIRR